MPYQYVYAHDDWVEASQPNCNSVAKDLSQLIRLHTIATMTCVVQRAIGDLALDA